MPSMGPSTGTSITEAPAAGLETALPHLLPSRPRRSRSPRIRTARRGPQDALAPCWCLALMLSKAYLLLGFYLHPLSLSARGSPAACATFPERAAAGVAALLCAVPDSGARADNARVVRTLAIAFPMTLPCPPHSSDATHAFAGARAARPWRRGQMLCRQHWEVLVVSSRGDSLTYQSHSSA